MDDLSSTTAAEFIDTDEDRVHFALTTNELYASIQAANDGPDPVSIAAILPQRENQTSFVSEGALRRATNFLSRRDE